MTRARTPQALRSRAPTSKESEGWKQRLAREDLSAANCWSGSGPARVTSTSPQHSRSPSPTRRRDMWGTAVVESRGTAPELPWVEAAARRYEPGVLGPMSMVPMQPPCSLMALPFGSHDKAVERSYSRYGYQPAEYCLRNTGPLSPGHTGSYSPSPTATGLLPVIPVDHSNPNSPSRQALLAAQQALAVSKRVHLMDPEGKERFRPGSGGRTATPEVDTPVHTVSVPEFKPYCPTSSGRQTPASNYGVTYTQTISSPTRKVAAVDESTGLRYTVHPLPIAPPRAAGEYAPSKLTFPSTPGIRRCVSPQRVDLVRRVAQAAGELVLERERSFATSSLLRCVTQRSSNVGVSAVHSTFYNRQ